MFAGNSQCEHFGVVRGGAFTSPDTDVGDPLVGMGVAVIGDEFMLGVDVRGGSCDRVCTSPQQCVAGDSGPARP